MTSKRYLLVFLLVLTLFSCKKNKNEVDFHHTYFPLVKGTFVEYEVMEINHDIAPGSTNGIHDTVIYKLKTVIGDTVIDNSGRIAREFYRYRYDDNHQEYKVQDLWTAIIDQERGELVEENQRRIKMVFAPTTSKEWDYNAFNNLDPVYKSYDKIHKPYSISNFDFDSTVFVEEDSTLTVISYSRKFEIYAKGVGMIKSNYQDFSINGQNHTKPIKGTEVFFTLINYGIE